MSAAPPAMPPRVLARLAGQVVALEEDAGARAGGAARALAGQPNVKVVSGPLTRRLAGRARPTMSIVLEGATEIVPEALSEPAQGRRPAGLRAGQRARPPKPCFIAGAGMSWAAGRFSTPARRCCRALPSRRLSPSDCSLLPGVAEISQFPGNLRGRRPWGVLTCGQYAYVSRFLAVGANLAPWWVAVTTGSGDGGSGFWEMDARARGRHDRVRRIGCSRRRWPTSLEGALVQAYQNNPPLNSQRASVRATDEGVPQALSGYRPRVTANGHDRRAIFRHARRKLGDRWPADLYAAHRAP